jgi:hypothetical protein
MCFKGKVSSAKTKAYCFIRIVFIPKKLGFIFNEGFEMKTKCEVMKEFFPDHPVIEEIECMKAMDKALNELWVKARNEAEKIEKQIGLNKLDDMVLESLIDDLMMERDARTYADEAERGYYKGLGI